MILVFYINNFHRTYFALPYRANISSDDPSLILNSDSVLFYTSWNIVLFHPLLSPCCRTSLERMDKPFSFPAGSCMVWRGTDMFNHQGFVSDFLNHYPSIALCYQWQSFRWHQKRGKSSWRKLVVNVDVGLLHLNMSGHFVFLSTTTR